MSKAEREKALFSKEQIDFFPPMYIETMVSDNIILALHEQLISLDETKSLSCYTLMALASDNGFCALKQGFITPKLAAMKSSECIEALVSSNGMLAFQGKYFTRQHLEKLELEGIKCMLSDNGLLALGKKWLTIDQIFLLPAISHIEDLLSDNGIIALRDKLLTPEVAASMCTQSLTYLLSNNGLRDLQASVGWAKRSAAQQQP